VLFRNIFLLKKINLINKLDNYYVINILDVLRIMKDVMKNIVNSIICIQILIVKVCTRIVLKISSSSQTHSTS